MDYELVRTYYSCARDLVKLNKPLDARFYVLKILNYGLDSYKRETNIEVKVRIEQFLQKWVKVSKDLYKDVITDYVKECFAIKDEDITYQSQQTEDLDIVSKIFKDNLHSVVQIKAEGKTQNSFGTGFIISKDGYLLTNHHVIHNGKLFMKFNDSNKLFNIEVVSSNQEYDIALCKFNPNIDYNYSATRCINDYNEVIQGETVILIGNSLNMGLAPVVGYIRYTKDIQGNLIFSAPTNHGDSGGPVFNKNGECIGINKSIMNKFNDRNVNLFSNATPMDKIKEILDKWMK